MIKNDQYAKLTDNLKEVTESIQKLDTDAQHFIYRFFKQKQELHQREKKEKN